MNSFQVSAMRKSTSGFTLIELMITLAVLAIILTIGYPLYNVQLEKARRTDARSGLAKLAMAQERYYGMFGNYAATEAELNFGPDGVEDGNNDVFFFRQAVNDLDLTNYNIVLNSVTPQDYVFTATAIGSQLEDTDCRVFTINQVGIKTAEDADSNDETQRCW
jgi:type IV pilus assembly protein PilE